MEWTAYELRYTAANDVTHDRASVVSKTTHLTDTGFAVSTPQKSALVQESLFPSPPFVQPLRHCFFSLMWPQRLLVHVKRLVSACLPTQLFS
jgi:hypothetical protein